MIQVIISRGANENSRKAKCLEWFNLTNRNHIDRELSRQWPIQKATHYCRLTRPVNNQDYLKRVDGAKSVDADFTGSAVVGFEDHQSCESNSHSGISSWRNVYSGKGHSLTPLKVLSVFYDFVTSNISTRLGFAQKWGFIRTSAKGAKYDSPGQAPSNPRRVAPGQKRVKFKSTESAKYQGYLLRSLRASGRLCFLSRGDAPRVARCLPLAIIFRAFGAGPNESRLLAQSHPVEYLVDRLYQRV